MHSIFWFAFEPALLIFIPTFQPNNLLNMYYNPFNPSLNFLLWYLFPAFDPGFLQLNPRSDCSLFSILSLYPEPTRLYHIQIWRIRWPEQSRNLPDVKNLLLVS